MGSMTIAELQRIALRLGNSGWCRWWAHFNWPQTEPHLMALQVLDTRVNSNGFHPKPVPDLEKLGFELDPHHPGLFIYVIRRVNEDGTPFVSRL